MQRLPDMAGLCYTLHSLGPVTAGFGLDVREVFHHLAHVAFRTIQLPVLYISKDV